MSPNTSLVLRSAAQRSGGERSFYAPRRRAPHEGREGVSNCALESHFETPPSSPPHQPPVPSSQGCRAGVGGDRARPEWRPRAPAKKTNTHPPHPVCFFGGPGTTESLFLQARVRDDDTAKCCRKAVTDRGDVAASHDVTISPRSRNRRPASPTSGRHSCDLGHQVNNEVGYRTSYGRFPKRENRNRPALPHLPGRHSSVWGTKCLIIKREKAA